MYSEQDRDEIILDYFGTPGSEGSPRCPDCGESLRFSSAVIPYFGLQLDVRCEGCGQTFQWAQPQPERPWKDLHLSYFLERYLAGDLIRCPFDDSFVSHAEFSDSVLQFNCPYCNRRGKVKLAVAEE